MPDERAPFRAGHADANGRAAMILAAHFCCRRLGHPQIYADRSDGRVQQFNRAMFFSSVQMMRSGLATGTVEQSRDGTSGSGTLAAISGQNLETEMYNALLATWIRFRHNDEGVTLVEYGVAVALAVLVGTGAMALLAGDIGSAMGAAGDAMPD